METNNNQPANPPVNTVQIPPAEQPEQSKKGHFPIVLLVLVLLPIVAGGAYYLLTQNTKPTQIDQKSPTPTATVKTHTQTPQDTIYTVFRLPVDGKDVNIDRSSLKNTDNVTIDTIASYEVSPDKTKLALLANGGLSTHFLYITDTSGEKVTYIGTANEVEWSNDGTHLAYTSPVTDIGPDRFKLYELETGITKELEKKSTDNPTRYTNLQWSVDDQSISAEVAGDEKIASGKQIYPLSDFK